MLYDCELYPQIQVSNTYTPTRQNCPMNASISNPLTNLLKWNIFLTSSIHNESNI